MKLALAGLIVALMLTGCSRLDTLAYEPHQTPETWLAIQPWLALQFASHSIILVQPTTSAIVYLLSLVTLGSGLFVFQKRDHHLSRLWWGIALLLWGLGAFLAGTSYEAFSYQIKCAGREACVWTSEWEIGYLLLSVASVNAIVMAQAYSCATGKLRRTLVLYALINTTIYCLAVLIGIVIPVKFLISFELLILAAAPSILIFILLNGQRYSRLRHRSDLLLLITWGWLALTIGAYFVYFLSGLTQVLWTRGVWFSENDVLHIGLIIWMIYIAWAVIPHIKDLPETSLAASI